jgi:hypothetical protein
LCFRIEPVHDVADVDTLPEWVGGGRMSEDYNERLKSIARPGKRPVTISKSEGKSEVAHLLRFFKFAFPAIGSVSNHKPEVLEEAIGWHH